MSIVGLFTTALGFVVGPVREVGMGARFSVGVIVGVALKYVQDLLPPMSLVFEFPPWVAVLLPVVIVWGGNLLGSASVLNPILGDLDRGPAVWKSVSTPCMFRGPLRIAVAGNERWQVE